MQDIIEENKVLKKAMIIASSSLKEVESKVKKSKEENENLNRSVPQFSHLKLNMPVLLDDVNEKLEKLRKAVAVNKNMKVTLLEDVKELREIYACREEELKSLRMKNQLEKKGSYSRKNLNKKFTAPASTPKAGLKKNKSESFF